MAEVELNSEAPVWLISPEMCRQHRIMGNIEGPARIAQILKALNKVPYVIYVVAGVS